MNTFLENLYSAIQNSHGQFIELRAFDELGNRRREFIDLNQLEKVDEFISNYNEQFNCFYGVATRKNSKSGRKEDCRYLPAIYIDVDCDSLSRRAQTLFKNKEAALNHIARLNLGETAIIDSGNGFHLYWFFDKPVELNKPNIEMLEEFMKSTSRIYGGDNTHDISRILRIPGSHNVKDKPIKCSVIRSDYSKRYSLENLVNKITSCPAYNIVFENFRAVEIERLIFGKYDESKFKSRSEVDQKILTWLIGNHIPDDQVRAIFRYLPTTGKFLELLEKSESGANSYLDHSINNAYKYLNEADSVLVAEDEHYDSENEDDEFELRTSPGELGYYKVIHSGNKVIYKRMTNFHITVDRQIKKRIDNRVTSVFSGEINFEDGSKSKFDDLPAECFASVQDLKKYLLNYFGTKIRFVQFVNQIPEAIKSFSKKVNEVESRDFGFSDNLIEYVTSDSIITKDGSVKKETPILFDHIGSRNYLGFGGIESEPDLIEIKRKIYQNLYSFDEPAVTLYSLAFTFLPIIFPFIREYCNGKPYLILHGPSGCGKSTMIYLMQSFFGIIKNLNTFSSTPNSLEIKGHSFKDALYCIDDMKSQNIPEKDRNKIQLLFQNYGDETGRNRANVNLDIREQRYIRGIVMVSAEDLVLTETSTLARGIVVPVAEKEPDLDKRNILVDESQNYRLVMKSFIADFLSKADQLDFQNLFKEKQTVIDTLRNNLQLVGGNVPRLINNFAVIHLTFDLICDFLFDFLSPDEKNEINNQFLSATVKLLKTNFNQVQDRKPEEKFEQTLWEMIEMNLLHLVRIDQLNNVHVKTDDIVGYIWFKDDGTEKVGLNFNNAYRKVNQFLQSEGGIGHSKETILQKLIQLKKVRIPSANGLLKDSRISFGNYGTQRGIEWIDEVPYDNLKIAIPFEYSQAKKQKEYESNGRPF